MRTLIVLLALSACGFAAEPKIVLRGTYAKGAEGVPVGDWRNYGVEGFTGKLDWELDPLPELGTVDGKPALVYGAAAMHHVTEPLTPFRVNGDKLDVVKIPAGDVVLAGVTPGKVKLTARGVVDGASKRLATLVIDIGPRGPPAKPVEPPAGQVSLNLLVVRKDGPATQAFADTMALPAWDRLRSAGHNVLDVSASDAAGKLNLKVSGVNLPAVFPSYVKGGRSYMIGLPLPLPTTESGILKLGEIKP